MRYQYTGDLPAVTEFQHGQDGVTLTRAVPKLSLVVPTVNDTDEPLPDEFEPAVEVGTIVIEPGDILALTEPDDILVHAHFALLDGPAPEGDIKPETDRQRKAREKREAADAKPADASPATPPQDSSSSPAHPDAAPVLTPETGAQRSAADNSEPGNPAELGTVLDSIATEHIPAGMTDAFRSAGIIPDQEG